MPAPTLETNAPLLPRLIAVASAALFLLLGAATVSPALHNHLHGHEADHAAPTHTCAVVLFATGLVLAAALSVIAPRTTTHDLVPAIARSLFLAAPRHLLPPERGPPVC